MNTSHGFLIPASPEVLAAFLANPVNIGVSNREGRIVEHSPHAATQSGSWSVVAIGRIRTRVEYLIFDPPHEVAVSLVASGPGSGGQRGTWRYLTTPDADTGGTRVRVEIASPSRVTDPIAGLLLPIMWWQLGRRLRGIASSSRAA